MKLAKTQIILATLAILTAGAASTNVLLDNFATINQTTTIDHPQLHVENSEDPSELIISDSVDEENIDLSDHGSFVTEDIPEDWHNLQPVLVISDTVGDSIEDEDSVEFSVSNTGNDAVDSCTFETETSNTEIACEEVLDLENDDIGEFELNFNEFNAELENHPYVVLEGDN